MPAVLEEKGFAKLSAYLPIQLPSTAVWALLASILLSLLLIAQQLQPRSLATVQAGPDAHRPQAAVPQAPTQPAATMTTTSLR